MKKQRNQHEWGFMGNDTKGRGDLAYCELCKKWSWTYEKDLFKMKSEDYQKMIDTEEVIGI